MALNSRRIFLRLSLVLMFKTEEPRERTLCEKEAWQTELCGRKSESSKGAWNSYGIHEGRTKANYLTDKIKKDKVEWTIPPISSNGPFPPCRATNSDRSYGALRQERKNCRHSLVLWSENERTLSTIRKPELVSIHSPNASSSRQDKGCWKTFRRNSFMRYGQSMRIINTSKSWRSVALTQFVLTTSSWLRCTVFLIFGDRLWPN